MLDKNDIQVLRDMFRENNATFKLEMRGEMLDLISASEKRIIAVVDNRVSAAEKRITADVIQRISAAEQCIISEVTDCIGSSILPQIDEHNMRINRLERHTMLVA